MVRRSRQLNSTQNNWFAAKHRLLTRAELKKFINHANYKIIDSNVMDWVNVTKIHTPPSVKRYFPPPDECSGIMGHKYCHVTRVHMERETNRDLPLSRIVSIFLVHSLQL